MPSGIVVPALNFFPVVLPARYAKRATSGGFSRPSAQPRNVGVAPALRRNSLRHQRLPRMLRGELRAKKIQMLRD
jgi:hypothetical protein